MNAEFWGIVDALGGVIDDVARDDLAETLTALGDDVVAFERELQTCVEVLDTAELRAVAQDQVHDGTGIALSDDTFLDLRLAIVASGRRRFEAAVADPGSVGGH